MKNPFEEFRRYADRSEEKTIPLDEILASHESLMARLTEGYKLLVADEVGEGLWRPDGDSIERIYARAQGIVADIRCRAGDIEAFCLHAMQSEDPDFFLMGPLGLYLSALCNGTDAPAEIQMNLVGQDLRVPLLGFRLKEEVHLSVQGDLGDLVGISLGGGHLEVEGNVGRYLGAGMTAGRIDVSGDAGRFIGEQMVGGEIHIQGRPGGLGKPQGGAVFHRKRPMYSEGG